VAETLLARAVLACSNGTDHESVAHIGVLECNREKKLDLVATGILPVTFNRRARIPSYLDQGLEACPTILYYPPILSVAMEDF
jgi:hypothetical protein